MGTVQAVVLPGEEEYEAAEKAIGVANDAIEQIVWKLNAFSEAMRKGPEAPHVSYEDIGRVAVYVDGLGLYVEQLGDHLKELQQAIPVLDEARLERRRA